MKTAVALFILTIGTLFTALESAPLERIAFGSCLKENKPQLIWSAVVSARPQLFLFTGDNIYGDTDDMVVLREKYQMLNAQPGYQLTRSLCPVLATWDDHDYGRNDAGAEYESKRESQTAFLDTFAVPATDERRQREGVYHAEIFGPPGQRVQVILLDTRYHRSELAREATVLENGRPYQGYVATTTPGATFLGETQWNWLGEQLRQPAEIRLLISSIQVVSEEHVFEKWANIPAERERLFALIRDTGAEGLVILSGDRHLADLSVMDAGLGYPLYDLTASGMTEGNPNFRYPEKNRHRLAGMFTGNHFGLVEIEWSADPILSLQIRDEAGLIRLQERIPLSRLSPKRQ